MNRAAFKYKDDGQEMIEEESAAVVAAFYIYVCLFGFMQRIRDRVAKGMDLGEGWFRGALRLGLRFGFWST